MIVDLEHGNLRVLVTGGAGFIGGFLIRRLLLRTNANVFNLDKLNYASDLSRINDLESHNRHTLLKVDLNNLQDTVSAIKRVDPDIIFHLAAESHVDRSIDNPTHFIHSNILGTFNLLESAKQHYKNMSPDRKKRFRYLHVSTDEVFGSLGKEGMFSEETSYSPRSPYSASKAASDHLTSAWFHTYKLPVIITNCSNNFGPYQFPEKLIPLVIQKAIEKSKIPIYGNGDNIRDWIYVEDHVDALILVILQGKVGSNYCIGGNNEKTNLEMVNCICELLDEKLPSRESYKKQIEFVKDRPGHDKRYAIDTSLIRTNLGWEQKNDFTKSLSNTIDWYLNNQEWCRKIQKKSNYNGQRIGIGKIK